MTELIWNQEGQNQYEYSVDHGVFYTSDNRGYVWNGLVSVNSSSEGGDIDSYHFDGVKYLDVVKPRNYNVTVSAFSTPLYFARVIGDQSIVPGFILTRQTRDRFGFSYRTFIGGSEGYKIHLVYNALATPTGRTYPTIDDSAEAELYSWKIDAVPIEVPKARNSAHFILDSTKMDPSVLVMLERILYGSTNIDARLPTVDELSTMWLLVIKPQPVTGLADLIFGTETGDLAWAFEGFYRALPQTRLTPTTISGLYRLE